MIRARTSFYCDREWNCLDDTYHQDLAAAEAQALFEFPGVVFVGT
jgi:hypothetical protein